MKSLYSLILIGTVLFLADCESTISPYPLSDEVLYFNSFETEVDTAGWNRFGSLQLKNDTPLDGGNHSVYISGGCTVPHAALQLPSIDRDMHLKLHVWGKNLERGGGVLLRNMDTEKIISVSIEDSTWKSYQSSEKLFVRSGDRISLSMVSGGFIPSAMLVDLVEIRIVE